MGVIDMGSPLTAEQVNIFRFKVRLPISFGPDRMQMTSSFTYNMGTLGVYIETPDILPVVLAQISMGRAGQPREVGHVVAFFASDEASYLTGQSVHVDGGWEGK